MGPSTNHSALYPLHVLQPGNSPQIASWGFTLTSFVYLLSKIRVLCFLLSENYLTYFAQFSSCLRKKGESSSYYSSMARSRSCTHECKLIEYGNISCLAFLVPVEIIGAQDSFLNNWWINEQMNEREAHLNALFFSCWGLNGKNPFYLCQPDELEPSLLSWGSAGIILSFLLNPLAAPKSGSHG